MTFPRPPEQEQVDVPVRGFGVTRIDDQRYADSDRVASTVGCAERLKNGWIDRSSTSSCFG